MQDEEKKVVFASILPHFAKHVSTTLIRNFAAYKFVFTEQRKETTQMANLSVNTPLPTRPLSAFNKVDGDADSIVEGSIASIEAGEDEPVE